MINLTERFVRGEEGQDLIEYALLAALIAVMLVSSMRLLSDEATNIFERIIDALINAGG